MKKQDKYSKQAKHNKKKKHNKKLIFLIILMLLLVAVASGWLVHRAIELRKARMHQFVAHVAEDVPELSDSIRPEAADTACAAAAAHVYSHRGSAGKYEHSFRAYDSAIASGSRYIEQDVVLSSDGVLFVSHDLNASDMTGTDSDYSDMTAAEIDKLTTKADEKVLRLSEVFDHYGRGIHYVIDLRTGKDAVQAFIDIVDKYKLAHYITVQSDDGEVLSSLEEKYPHMQKLLLCSSQDEFESGLDVQQADIISVKSGSGLINEDNCNAAHEKGKLFSAWTLNTEWDIRQAIDIGTDTYFTDDTSLAIVTEKQFRHPIYVPDGNKAKEKATVFFTSDFQPEDGFQAPADTLTDILEAIKSEGIEPDNAVFCGDYSNIDNMYDYQISPDTAVTEIRKIVNNEFRSVMQQDMIFVQGNHDSMTDHMSSSGLHEYDDYLIYVLNTEQDFPWKQGKNPSSLNKTKNASEEMAACFEELIRNGEKRPVFIAGHVPLHFTAKTTAKYRTGDNMYSAYIFNAVNKAANDLDIIYIFGHNHSKGWDCYLGGSCVYKEKGETVLIPDAGGGDSGKPVMTGSTDSCTEEILNFTYMNAGYCGYYMNCGPKEAAAGEIDDYHAADETLTGTVFDIYPEEIVITRYASDGVHQLGAAGEASPYDGKIDEDLIDSEFYSYKTDSPVHIKRRQN